MFNFNLLPSIDETPISLDFRQDSSVWEEKLVSIASTKETWRNVMTEKGAREKGKLSNRTMNVKVLVLKIEGYEKFKSRFPFPVQIAFAEVFSWWTEDKCVWKGKRQFRFLIVSWKTAVAFGADNKDIFHQIIKRAGREVESFILRRDFSPQFVI